MDITKLTNEILINFIIRQVYIFEKKANQIKDLMLLSKKIKICFCNTNLRVRGVK